MKRALTYSVVLEPQPEGGFLVVVPALPEVVTEGDTEVEALTMAEDAIRLALAARHAHGDPLPEPDQSRLHKVTVRAQA